MTYSRNPSRSRPLSPNVKRLMKMARESPENPAVIKIQRSLTARDYIYCNMQGEVFMAAVDLGYDLRIFAETFMTSQLAGVIDHSFSDAGGMENDEISVYLKIPLILKSPERMAMTCMWLDEVVSLMGPDDNPRTAVLKAARDAREEDLIPAEDASKGLDFSELTELYIYAYWLGYIYRCECLLHDESSRMVYGAFPEKFMRKTYEQMMPRDGAFDIDESAPEICRRLDILLIGTLWKEVDTKNL